MVLRVISEIIVVLRVISEIIVVLRFISEIIVVLRVISEVAVVQPAAIAADAIPGNSGCFRLAAVIWQQLHLCRSRRSHKASDTFMETTFATFHEVSAELSWCDCAGLRVSDSDNDMFDRHRHLPGWQV